MKKFTLFSKLTFIFCAALILASCGGDDKEAAPNNQVKLDGETIKFTEAHIGSELNINDEFGEYSYHEIFLLSDGLTMNETGALSGAGDMVRFGLISKSLTELKDGTYNLKLNSEVGDIDYFEVYSNLTIDGPDVYYAAYRGSVKVVKSGEKYTITFNFDIFTSETETTDEEFVEGEIKGNYKGTVDLIVDGGTRLPSGKAAKSKKTFTWE